MPEPDARVLSAVCPLPREGSVHPAQLQIQLPNGVLVKTDWVRAIGGGSEQVGAVELVHVVPEGETLPPGKPRVVLHSKPLAKPPLPESVPAWLELWLKQHPGLWFGDRHLPVLPKSGPRTLKIREQFADAETWAGVLKVGGGFSAVRAFFGLNAARVDFVLNCGMDAQTPGGDVRVDSIRFDAAGEYVVSDRAPAHVPHEDVFFEGTLASFSYWIGPDAPIAAKMGGHSILVGEFSFSNPAHEGWTAREGVLPADPSSYAERLDRVRWNEQDGTHDYPDNTVRLGYRPKVGPNYGGVTGGGELGMFFGAELAAAGPSGIRQLLWDCWADETRGANLITDGGKPFVPEEVDFKYDIIEGRGEGAEGFDKNHLGETGQRFKEAWFDSQTSEPVVPWHSALRAAQPDDEQHLERLFNRWVAAVAACNDPVSRWKLAVAAGSVYCSQAMTKQDWKTNSLQALLDTARANPAAGAEMGRGEGEGAECVIEGLRHLRGTPMADRLANWLKVYRETVEFAQTPQGAIMRKHGTKYARQVADLLDRPHSEAPGVSQHWEGILAVMALPPESPAVGGALSFADWCWNEEYAEPYAWVCIADEPGGALYETLGDVPETHRSTTLRKRWTGGGVEYFEAPMTDSFYLGALIGRCLLPSAPDADRRLAAEMLCSLARQHEDRKIEDIFLFVEGKASDPITRGMWLPALGALDTIGTAGLNDLLQGPMTGLEGITQ